MISKIKILLAVFALFIYAESATAQVPQMFNYQGIARDAKGNPLGNQKMALKLSVMPTADATVPEYEETQIVNTNEFGLYTLQIGNGTPVTGEMKTVKWETGNKYIKVAIDPTGGTNYADAGTSQLLSVPYAIYADKAGTASNGGHDKTRTGAVSSNAAHVAGDANYITKFTALNTIGKSLIYESAIGNIGIGTIAPGAKFQITNTVAAVQEHIRMQNLSTTGAGRFTMYNDGLSSYATFTKYGSAYAGGYTGIAAMYPYANLLAFGNNSTAVGDGRFLISTAGNAGISLYKGGTSKLKFHADFTTENVGIGGNAAPVNRVHLNNSDGTDMTVGVTNNTSGHTATDGLVIRENGNAASIINMENSTLDLGTNNLSRMTIDAVGNVGIGTNTPTYKLHVQHGGATGILSKSALGSGSFSVVDIDGDNGDAALRFQRAGVGQWNVRNRPGDDYFEIFELGGGGSRMVIQNTTGNVGIGTNITPSTAYKLTVQPDGASAVGGINVTDAVDEYSFYAQKSGLFDAIYLSKTNPTTSTPTLSVYSASPNAYGSYISSGGMGMYSSATAGAGIYSTSYKSYGIEANADSMSAGYFHSSGSLGTSGLLANGVLRGQFTGAGNNDVAGVFGVSQPASNYGYGVRGLGNYAGVRGAANTGGFTGIWGDANGGTYAGYFSGNVNITGSLAKGSGTFKIDHPLDPENKYLYHSFVESPDMMNIYNGNIITDANGDATVTMPDYFEALNKEFRYQLTAIGSFAQAMISEEISGNTFKIKTNQPNVKISWQVTGIRHDKYADQNRVVAEVEKEAQFKGKYIHPTAWGQPLSKGIDYSLDHKNGQNSTSEAIQNIPTDIKAMEKRAEAERKSVSGKKQPQQVNKVEEPKNSSIR